MGQNVAKSSRNENKMNKGGQKCQKCSKMHSYRVTSYHTNHIITQKGHKTLSGAPEILESHTQHPALKPLPTLNDKICFSLCSRISTYQLST